MYVGILIGNYDYELMEDQIPAMVLEKNREHNVKSSQETLLIDKQGILYLTPHREKQRNRRTPKFSRTYDLYEIALVYSDFMRNYLSYRLCNEDFYDFILYKIRPWIENSKVIFSRSKSHWLMWNLLIEELSLKPQLDFIIDRVAGNAVADKSEYFDQFAIGWWNESDFAYLLAKRIEESKELQLGFLENEELKKLIIEDYAEARRSFHSKNYKATILLCGSVAEAMLTAVVAKAGLHGISIAKLYKDYNLSMLVNVAKEHSLIRDKALFSLLDSIRHYRNIIHPGVQIRKSLAPDSSKASIAIETISLLGKELNKISI